MSLEKKLQKDAPQLVSLAKPLQLELVKQNLQNTVARVALVLDISGSMSGRYSDGTIQEIVNKRVFALDDFKRVSNSELYSRLLNEFPKWLKEIKRKRMI